MSETTNRQVSSAIIYGIEDRPPFKEALFAALQHLLAIFVAIITPPLIIAEALNLDLETTGFLVSMALFASGVSTFIQCRRVGPINRVIMYSRNKFLVYRPDYIYGIGGWFASDIRGVHGWFCG